LFAGALVNLIGSGTLVVVGPLLLTRQQLVAEFLPELFSLSLAMLLCFGCTALWARWRPIAAVSTAGGVFVVLTAVQAWLVPALTMLDLPAKIIVAAMLIQALQLGCKQHRLAPRL
jgi:hypothetical protein